MSSLALDVQPPSETKINWEKLLNTIEAKLPEVDTSHLTVKQFTAGYSNLTYLLQFPNKHIVLRRPPFGEIPPRAHDIQREYTILSHVHPVFPLAPKPHLYEENQDIMDKHFYLMEKKEGVVLDDRLPEEWDHMENAPLKASQAVVDTLATLHDIDIYKHGLDSLGKPEGYLKRQIEGWLKRYERSIVEGSDAVQEIIPWLLANTPNQSESSIVHNDFKLNNMMFSKDDPEKAVGVFDWELCTVGDPLSDFAGTMAYWTEPGDAETGLASVTEKEGFYSRRDLVEAYASNTGRDMDNIHYYLCFAFLKIAVILQQIYYRWHKGEISDSRFSSLGIGINNLLHQSIRAKDKEIV
ncbi:phosphotransferase family protein [Alteribacillus sp. JSM 102045]|uniref:phosphotransferase family protein n=1 Tax=Alteribacillus sp. JSM 102045 TaxID=1562101 RepID=UPI0035BF9BB2